MDVTHNFFQPKAEKIDAEGTSNYIKRNRTTTKIKKGGMMLHVVSQDQDYSLQFSILTSPDMRKILYEFKIVHTDLFTYID